MDKNVHLKIPSFITNIISLIFNLAIISISLILVTFIVTIFFHFGGDEIGYAVNNIDSNNDNSEVINSSDTKNETKKELYSHTTH